MERPNSFIKGGEWTEEANDLKLQVRESVLENN
jgi:hypothetical protein